MTRKFMENLDQDSGDVVPGGTYTLEVVDARAVEGKAFLWIDFRVVGGPDDGRVVSPGLNLPDDSSSRGAIFHFKKKIRGFLPQLAAANVLNLPDEEQPDAIAEAILGARVDADLSVQVGGDYDGSQQLDETRQIVDLEAPETPTPAAPTPRKKKTPEAPAAEAEVVDEVAALRAKLAALEGVAEPEPEAAEADPSDETDPPF